MGRSEMGFRVIIRGVPESVGCSVMLWSSSVPVLLEFETYETMKFG